MFKMPSNYFDKNIDEHMKVMESLRGQNGVITKAINKMTTCFYNKGSLLVMGNGGSFADALHIEGELVGRFKVNRRPFPVKALGSGLSTLTAVANDFSYDEIFSREVEAYALEGDILFGITTSGNSLNIIKAFEKGRELRTYNILMSGKTGGEVKKKGLADLEILVDSTDTARIQEAHQFIYHTICEVVERNIFNKSGGFF